MKIVFFGSSDFSIPALRACQKENLLLVITTPDQPQGRGLKIQSTPVKQFAEHSHIPCISPESLKDPAVFDHVKAMSPELFVVSSYGKMIPQSWLSIPSLTRINVHPSLIPKYRGAAPIQRAVLNGDSETGITLMDITAALDAGDIYYQAAVPIPSDYNSMDLTQLLSKESETTLLDFFALLKKGSVNRSKQNESLSTYAEKLTKEDGYIKWQKPAIQIHNQIRGSHPWPLAQCLFKNSPVHILASKLTTAASTSGAPGQIVGLVKNQGLEVMTGQGSILITQLKPSGKKTMPAIDFANGQRIKPGDEFQSL